MLGQQVDGRDVVAAAEPDRGRLAVALRRPWHAATDAGDQGMTGAEVLALDLTLGRGAHLVRLHHDARLLGVLVDVRLDQVDLQVSDLVHLDSSVIEAP